MARDPNIPLFLWIATAVLCHLLGGGGADRVAKVIQERLDVQRFAESVRAHVQRQARPLEVSLLESPEPEKAAEEPEPPEPAPEDAPPSKEPVLVDKPREEEKKKTAKEQSKVQHPEQKPEEKKPEEKKPEEKKPEEKRDFPKVQVRNRIAVQQHVEDEDQKDNPDAEFIADQANRVKEQTQARITATDQNDPSPNPGSSYQGPMGQPGNAYESDIAHSEDSPGEVDRAPNEKQGSGEKRAEATSVEVQKGGGSPNASSTNLESNQGKPNGTDRGDAKSPGAQEERKAVAEQRAQDAHEEALTSKGGSFAVPEAQEQKDARRAEAGRTKRLPPRKGQAGPMDFLGLGAAGTTRGGINLNLSHGAAVAAVGRDQLARERLADGERRRSKHRGSWKTLGIERWRAAIENYNSSVKPGNQTALNTARVPFASYLNQIHNRLHPIFADSFLSSLEGLPREHPLSRPDMKTNLEIVLDRNDGKIVKMGVTHSSGSTVFDIAALESVQSASPFGKPPSAIISRDGNVYLHWEFYRNPYYACSTYFARPFMLNIDPKSEPPRISPPSPFGPQEEPVPPAGQQGRQGLLIPSVHSAPKVHAAR